MATTSGSSAFGAVRAQLDALPRRSRLLLAVLLGLVGIVWMLGLWWWTSGSLAAQAEDLSSRQKTLRQLQLLQKQYVDAEQLIADAEERLGRAATQNPSSFIESKASEHDVREMLTGIEKLTSETRGSLKETRYRVRLDRAPVQGTMELMHDIETAGFMAVENASVQSKFVKGDRLLNTTLDLVAYELVKGAE